jgi:hypothetical protein
MIQIASQSSGQRYAELQHEVNAKFPAGRFVALEAGVVLAAAESHSQIVKALQAQGKSPRDTVILQAGASYLANATIF